MEPQGNIAQTHWFVMRDLKRPNAKLPAYKQLEAAGLEVFTPVKWHLKTSGGKRVREQVPVIQDLLFVHDTRQALEPILDKTPTLQFRYVKGTGYRNPMTVPDTEMEQFILAAKSSDNPEYYLPEELSPQMYGRLVQIAGGPLDGCLGRLLTIRGSKKRRLLVELTGFLSVGVEIKGCDYIKVISE